MIPSTVTRVCIRGKKRWKKETIGGAGIAGGANLAWRGRAKSDIEYGSITNKWVGYLVNVDWIGVVI